MSDFFISYTSVDRPWAEWIAFILEEEGLSVLIQAWDFRPGSNFVLEMQKAAEEADRTIMVLSPDYLKSQFASPEWAAAFAKDPNGLERKLLPIMVRQCQPTGLLASLVHISLVAEDEDSARKLLLGGLRAERVKPARRPVFPGSVISPTPRTFPGSAGATRSSAYIPSLKKHASDAEKRRFSREAFDVIKSHFEAGLHELAQQDVSIECDFQANVAAEFTAEVFVGGKSRCRCRLWLGAMFSSDGISYAEGQLHHGSNACNEALSVVDDGGALRLSALMATGFGSVEGQFDLKRMTPANAADYLWRRFLLPLER